MKWTSEIRAKFQVYILSSDLDRGAAYRAALAQEGFDTFLFTDEELLYSRVKEGPPHVLVLTANSLSVPLEEFVQAVLNLNSEIHILPVFPDKDLFSIVKYRPYNFASVIVEGESLVPRVTWGVDEICQSLYLTYQNEQLFGLYEKSRVEIEQLKGQISEQEKATDVSSGLAIHQEFQKYLAAKSKDEVLGLFLHEIQQKFLLRNKKIKSVYFKYLPTLHSLVAFQSLGFDIEVLQGVGCRLREVEAFDPVEFFSKGGVPGDLLDLTREGLNAKYPLIRPVFTQGELDGFLTIWSDKELLHKEEINDDFSLFNLMYERAQLEKKLISLDLSDNVTELYGRQYYLKQLKEEVARARRLQKAVTVVKISVDHFPELQQTLGRGGRDQILRSIAVMIKKSSRVNDISCRTGENEFSLILPHAPRKGASLRAERVRRAVEANSQKWTGVRFTVSCGIGEYPSHCSSAEDLDKASLQALEFISQKGGNKVCLFQPTDSFRPDYDVPPM